MVWSLVAVIALALVLLVSLRTLLALRHTRRVLASYRPTVPIADYYGDTAVVAVPTHRGGVLHVEIDGPPDAATTVVLLHDWTRDLRDWTAVRERLIGYDARVVLIELRGHGRSTWKLNAPIGCERQVLATDLGVVVNALADQSRLVLVGHGLGGRAVLDYLVNAPHRLPQVAGVVTIGTGQLTAAVRRAADLTRLQRGLATLGRLPFGLARLIADPGSTAYAVAGRSAHVLGYLDTADLRRALGGADWAVPWTAIVPEADAAVPVPGQLTLAGAGRQTRTRSLPGVGHDAPTVAAAAVAEEILTFVAARPAPDFPVQQRRPLRRTPQRNPFGTPRRR